MTPLVVLHPAPSNTTEKGTNIMSFIRNLIRRFRPVPTTGKVMARFEREIAALDRVRDAQAEQAQMFDRQAVELAAAAIQAEVQAEESEREAGRAVNVQTKLRALIDG